VFRRSRRQVDEEPATAPDVAHDGGNDADSALVRIREKEAEIAGRLTAAHAEAEEIVASAEISARAIKAEAALEAERLAVARAAAIARESAGAIVACDEECAAARVARTAEREARIGEAVEYLVERIITV